MRAEAKVEFGDIVDRFNKAVDYAGAEEEKKGDQQDMRTFNILKKSPPCFLKTDIELTAIEKEEQTMHVE